jgi:hypothetical protein
MDPVGAADASWEIRKAIAKKDVVRENIMNGTRPVEV